MPSTSVIISTYNSPGWLKKVLEGFFAQSTKDFEIVIADDGSTPATLALLRELASRSPVRITHVWQVDDGFQKCRILNKAIAVSRGERLIFTDGDCVPPPNFVLTHQTHARDGYFLTGAYFKLPMPLSDLMSSEDIAKGRPFHTAWLLKKGLNPSLKLLKMLVPTPFSKLANRITPTKRTWNGHNASCLRSQAIAVNGFNEDIQYGGQDVEFGIRLNHLGVFGKHIRFNTVPLHLYHGHGYVTQGMQEKSIQQRRATIQDRTIRAANGLDQWLDPLKGAALDPQDRFQVVTSHGS
jgi:glycosyltransferase involved in cell wall biosynthesis